MSCFHPVYHSDIVPGQISSEVLACLSASEECSVWSIVPINMYTDMPIVL